MADADIRKRLNYFTGMFLQEGDFKAEQSYHVEQQRQQNKLLFTPGIIEPETGLTVTVSTDLARLTVTPGIAIDQEGHVLMVLESDSNRTLTATSESPQEVFLVMSYQTLQTDIVSDGQPSRLFEQPRLELVPVSENPPEDLQIRLARLTTDTSGVVGDLNLTVRKTAGVKVAGGLASLTVGTTVVSNPGNTINLVAGGAVTINPNNTTKRITIGENHSGLRNNPHGVTATQVGALSVGGGTINGNVQIGGNSAQNLNLQVLTTTAGTAQNPGSAMLVWNGAGANRCGLVAKITASPTSAPNPVSAAIAGVSNFAAVHGVYATAPNNTHALNVEGTARISGGVSATHFVDTFINASGQRLTMGDVVKLKGTPVNRFRGLHNKAPVAEVTLADLENDTCVIGIVDCEAIPDSSTPDMRVDPDDPTFIEDGGELYLVTLGAYAHCKVDATEAAIAVGDLLTSSNNPGHAKKATNPQLGSIIGKALEPLKEGTGYIAVFVNIQ
jgi:hypothetical protein